MKRINAVVLAIFLVVFYLQAKTVVATETMIATTFNSNGDILFTGKTGFVEFEYNADGSLKKRTAHGAINLEGTLFRVVSTIEYDIYGNLKRQMNFDTDGNITQISEAKNTMITINGMNLLEKQEFENCDANRNFLGSAINRFEYNDNGDTIFSEWRSYDANRNLFMRGEGIYEFCKEGNPSIVKSSLYDGSGNIIVEGQITERTFIIINDRRFISSRKNPVYEDFFEYNTEGLLTKHTNYAMDFSLGRIRKNTETIFIYTFKEIETTAINRNQNAKTQNNFRTNRNSNNLTLNFANNSERRIEIVNLQGRVIKSQSFSAKIHSVNIENLPRNVYVLRVFENGKINSVRFTN